MNRFFLSAIAVNFLAGTAWALPEKVETNPHKWEPKVSSVTVFKNGMGFFLREGSVGLNNGWCIAESVPPAKMGTLIISPQNANEQVDVIGTGSGQISEFNGKDQPDTSEARRARLEAVKQLKLALFYKQSGGEKSAAGKLISIGPEYVVLENESNSFAVPVEGIFKIQLLESPTRIHVSEQSGKKLDSTTLSMGYLRDGLAWIPEYSLKLVDDSTAELTLRGTLVNEAEDLINCDVNFVVGVPNFLHSNQFSPLTIGQILRNTMATAGFSNSITSGQMLKSQQQSMEKEEADEAVSDPEEPVADLSASMWNSNQLDTGGASDFTVYQKKGLTARRGEKLLVTLFTKKVNFRHSYQWSPGQEIRHFLVMENKTDSAWTTGPCLVLSKETALSEDLLKYTARGDSAELPVTTAVNFSKEQKESETGRKVKVQEPEDHFFIDLVNVSGELKIKNLGKESAEIQVKLPIKGKPTSCSDAGSISTNTGSLKILELQGEISWKISVAPGESKTLTYKYDRYVPSR